jgi:hypothetical protein
MKKLGISLAVCLVAAATAISANAAIVGGSLNFSATGFTPVGAPVDPVTGTVTYSFDNSADFPDTTIGLTVTGLNIAGTSGPGMRYTAITDILSVGDLINGVDGSLDGTNDWILAITNISTNPTFRSLGYRTVEAGSFVTRTGTVTPNVTQNVAEPGSLALVAMVSMAVAMMSIRRRRGVVRP